MLSSRATGSRSSGRPPRSLATAVRPAALPFLMRGSSPFLRLGGGGSPVIRTRASGGAIRPSPSLSLRGGSGVCSQESQGFGRGGFLVVAAQLAVEDQLDQVVLDFTDPAAGAAARQGHQLVAVQRAHNLL